MAANPLKDLCVVRFSLTCKDSVNWKPQYFLRGIVMYLYQLDIINLSVWDNTPVTNISAKSGVTKSLKGIRNTSINTKHNMHILNGSERKHSQ